MGILFKRSVYVVCCIFFVCLYSCSNDNKDIVDIDNEEEKIFIGKWNGYNKWEFREDGTCTYSAGSGKYDGIWKYESESKTLITNVMEWNWKIISLTQDMWVGEHLAGKKGTYTYTRIK